MFITFLLYSGLDMIGEMPYREPVKPNTEQQTVFHEDSSAIEPDKPKDGAENKAPEIEKSTEVDSKVKPTPVTPPEEKEVVEKKQEATDSEDTVKKEEVKKEESSSASIKEVKVEDTSAEESTLTGYHYYIYSTSDCPFCIKQITEFIKHANAKDYTVVSGSKTKSGKLITAYPVVEVYKDDKLIHIYEGFTPYYAIEGDILATE